MTAAPFTVSTRKGDRLLQLGEVAGLVRRTDNQLRWLRHAGKFAPLFNSCGRLVAWESEVIAWLEQQQVDDANAI